MKQLNIKTKGNQFLVALVLVFVTTFTLQNKSYSQQQIGYYPNMDGGFQNQPTGNLALTSAAIPPDTLRWSYISSGNGQGRLVANPGGYGSSKFMTVGKTSAATTNSSTTVASNTVKNKLLLPSTLYVIQFFYRANTASVGIPDPASYVYISVDGTSGNRITKLITLGTPTTWTKYSDTVRTNGTSSPTFNGIAGINIKTTTIGTATLVDVDNFVIYPADNQTTGGLDITAPDAVTGLSAIANSPADVNVSWSAPSTGIDTGGFIVVRYSTNPGANDDPLQNAVYAIGDSVNGTNTGTVVYVGKGTSFLDNYKVNGNTTYYYKVYTADKAFNYSTSASTSATTQSFNTFYYNGTGAMSSVTSWGSNANGTGTNPVDFISSGQFFVINNTTNATVDAAWTVAGSSSKVILGDGTAGIKLTIPAGTSITGKLDLVAPASGKNSIVLNGGKFPTIGVVAGFPDLTVGTDVNTTIPKALWGDVVVASPSTVVINMSDTLYVNNFTINAGSVFSATTNAATNNTLPPVTIANGGAVVINGTFKTGKTAGFVATLNYLGTPNTTLGANSTIVFDKVASTTTQTVNALQYVNLVVGGASPKAFEVGTLKVSGDFIYSNNAGSLVASPASIEFNGASLQNIDGLPAPYFTDVTLSNGGLKKLHTSATINGIVNFVNGKLDVSSDTLFITALATVGAGVNNSYFVTGNTAAGRVVYLGVGASSTATVPVGSSNSYLPVMLTPTASYDFAVAAFEGLTTDGTFGGTPVAGASKAQSVDAFWNIAGITGTGNVHVEVNWPAGLEGATFSSLANNQVKLVEYNGAQWLPGAFGSANNSSNIAADSFSTFTVFAVTQAAGVLPASSVKLNATKINNAIEVKWNTINEINTTLCTVERSINGVDFTTVFTTNAAGNVSAKNYNFTDKSFRLGNNYYRIKIVDMEGRVSYSNIIQIAVKSNPSFVVLNNPIVNNRIAIQANALEDGQYNIALTNANGQVVATKEITVANNVAIMNLPIQNRQAAGTYYIRIIGNGVSNTIPVVIK